MKLPFSLALSRPNYALSCGGQNQLTRRKPMTKHRTLMRPARKESYSMKKITPLVLSPLALLSTLNPQLSTLHAQTTAFSYQGRLNDSGSPATGTYDLRFTIFDALASGNAVAGPLTNATVAVSNGLFTVLLDFGASAFPGADRFLELGVRTNGSAAAYTTLAPRQPVLPVPYAIQAANALNAATAATAAGLSGALPASSLTGILSDARLSPNVALLNGNQTFTGASVFNNATGAFHGVFSGNGAGVTNEIGRASCRERV